jgi:3-deoxy-D-manno-octulosonic-acid transferase
MWFILYRLVHFLLFPIILLGILVRFLRGKEGGWSYLKERFSLSSPQNEISDVKHIWIHGASVGESLSALGLIEVLLEKNPQLRILLTVGTCSARHLWQHRIESGPAFLQRVDIRFAPLACPRTVKRFLKQWKPCFFILLEGDLWPSYLIEARRYSVPVALVSTRLSSASIKRWECFPNFFFLAYCLRGVKLALAKTEETTQFLERAGLLVQAVPSLKWTVVSDFTVHSTWVSRTKKSLPEHMFWLAMSTHALEEPIIVEAYTLLQKSIPEATLILAPRHVSRVPEIFYTLSTQGMNVQCLSDFKEGRLKERASVLLVDQMGYADALFMLSHVIFIGGSLVPGIGGHNLIEPARHGKPLLHGPYMDNQTEVCSAFQAIGSNMSVFDAFSLARSLEGLLGATLEVRQKQGACIQAIAAKKQTSTLRTYVRFLAPLLKKLSL